MAEPVLLISSDPFLGASLEAVAHGRLEIARLDPAHRPPAWPASPSATVVLDVTARQREPMRTWIRRYHPGPLVILLKPGERRPTGPPDPGTVVVGRPFRLIELVALLEQAPGPPPAVAPEPDAEDPEGEQEPEEEDGGRREPPTADAGSNLREGERQPRPADSEGERQPRPADVGPPLGRVTDRRRSVEPLSTPPPRGGSRLPRPDWPTAATQLARWRRRRRPGWRARRLATRVLVGVLVTLVVVGAG